MKILKTKLVWSFPVFLLALFIVQAQMVISGTVTDPDGFSVPDAMVELASNSEISTLSDLDGNYSLSIPESEAVDGQVTLLISSLEMDDVQMTLPYQEGGVVQDLSFANNSKSLTELVAVGYGTVKKELTTSAVAVVDEEDFNKGFVTNAGQLIQGKVAGVQIVSDGSPQGGNTIRIRGGGSLSASQDPLIIIDGLPLDTGQDVSFLNPNDIESVSVLKDAASTAIYGNRGANGVIIYTTKKGSKDKGVKVNYSSQFTFNTMPYDYDNLSGSELTSLIENTNWANNGLTNPYDNLGVQEIFGDASSPRQYYNTNWMDEILNESFSSSHNLSLGGNLFNRIPTRFSTGYTGNNGVLITSKYQRAIASVSMNPTFFDNTLKVNVNANASSEKFNFADQGQISNAYSFDPTKPVRYDGLGFGNGYFEWADPDSGNAYGLAPVNPYAALVQKNNEQNSKRYYGNVQLDYNFPFLRDLRFVINGGLDVDKWQGVDNVMQGARSSYSPSTNVYVGNIVGFNGLGQNKLLDTYFVYNRAFNKFNMELTAGYSYQDFYRRSYNSGNQTDPTNPEARTIFDENRTYINIGYFGRANFDFQGKYLFNVNIRYDGTSKFGPDNQFEWFPGVSAAWVMSKENFMSSSSFVNNLKWRASYGRTGNQSIPAYQFIPLYGYGNSQSAYQFGNQSFIPWYPRFYNRGLKWETTDDWNVGLDYTIWGKRLSGSFDYYNKKTNDLLAEVNIAPGSNFANQGFTNQGDFTSEGFEALIQIEAIQKENMNLSFAYNAGYNTRKVNSLGDGGIVAVGGIGGLIGQNISYHQVGESPNSFYVYEQVFDANGRPLEGVYVDRNNDGIINADDRYFSGNPFPKWTMGFNTNFTYKDFGFAMNWRAQLGHEIYNNLKAGNSFLSNISGTGDWSGNVSEGIYDTGFVNKAVEIMQSDYFIEDGTFVKLDNLALSYNFRNLIGDGTSLSVNLSGNNLWIISDSDALDPEVYDGIYNNLYPRPRMYVLGFNLNF